jgi:acetylornithine deacetylase/succinyl-diaminopimelate desuccinylase-like protein
MATRAEDPTDEVTDLLQHLIRNQCVNDGTVESGHETRSVDLLADYLSGVGDQEEFEPLPGRESLVVRIEGSDPDAPSLLLMGHTDVVPVNPDGWSRDPFGGEVVDGMVWGRGAVDMLNLTASQAVAVRRLADRGFTPRGTLIYLAVADEEAQGRWGAEWLLKHDREAVYADYSLTESGGFQIPTSHGPRLPVLVGERGTFWAKVRVHGTPGHASAPYSTDNALVTAAEVVRRLAGYREPAMIHDAWRGFVNGIELDEDIATGLLDPDRFDEALTKLPVGLARQAHACTHATMTPTVAHGGTKTNVIPDLVELDVDIRMLPGQTGDDVHAMIADALGDLAHRVEVSAHPDPSTTSPVDTPLWDSLARVTARLCKGSALIPMFMIGGTDNRFFRRAGSVGYGFGLFSQRLAYEDYASMFHGNDERVDQESLALSEQLWEAVAHDLLD